MKHFLSIADLPSNELQNLLDLGISLKVELREGGNKLILKGKNLTHVSFEIGMVQLGGHHFYLYSSRNKNRGSGEYA